MIPHNLPLPLLRGALTHVPPVFLSRLLDGLVQTMAMRRPRLFRHLSTMDPARVRIFPTDLPHSFILHLGPPMPKISLAPTAPDTTPETPIAATIAGPLPCLIDMLEGRSDGDTLFFSRDITVTGDTHVIVTLRNVLDREEIDVTDDVVAMAGPFAPLARHALDLMARFQDKKAKSPSPEEWDHMQERLERLEAALAAQGGANPHGSGQKERVTS